MEKLLALILLLVGTAASAASMSAHDDEGTIITAYDEPCTNAAVLARLAAINPQLLRAGLPPLTPENLGRAVVVMEGKTLGACWAQMGQGVLVLDDGGDPERMFAVPVKSFSPGLTVRNSRTK